MKVLVSGGTGLVGRYIVEELLAAGYTVIIGGRHAPLPRFFSRPVEFAPLSLDPTRDHIEAFDDAYFFVHAAFHHLPGNYRGGEGDDPETFKHLNLDGSVRLFEAAKRAGTRRCIFISSRAAYGEHPPGTTLTEGMAEKPETLYGQVKLDAERSLAHLAAPGFATTSLRLTGVYGDLRPNKWDKLIEDYLAGRHLPSRAGTEVHGRDVGGAVRLMLEADTARISGETFNVSDVTLDTWDILEHIRWERDCLNRLPLPADKSQLTPMDTAKIRALGWSPGGMPLFNETIHTLATRT
ncbi:MULTISPECIES: NAD(P)-dependent oxidoreductase [unclassified Rhizobium]|uniref:NAD-dependent epimerase/dehydratase family protein n=1 Tax=unclassified Rhizobium TaxID=2613769 RepID=UPI00160A43DA|nr:MULTISPECIES: NAD(P)-dependent oxidoreductase [unclassified Rhizobium]MBB3541529.1 nucleoside-diphosphate-sugar epimerase [Rhizobium sp. BK399]MCS3740891.1 nucleoside-diphosphate-sugar epimerase [Rhizobium sp. BK661]MCS4092274.1 nucleoside-diphosphate-sugar epimerase [Rhizobium sp. BK176]